ncbi:flagellar hook-length control protein FliK [Segnochrobactrum spirostomi]|uniref:Flagellar hook-length control protein-like C-terminal domain-containing protein n=1 Tax=Segnochrobactrum spirostomi TaxID=2608987 RepID=A0A6A7Y502_9HYPH|nr:flagellar hook-length control protein FliK [Segnochrobactrum spirostomi]MQT12769.1 hypothetical protein [Segnochrobactrum spirostomi]
MTQIERSLGDSHALDVRGTKPSKGGDVKGGDAPAFDAMLTSLADGTEEPLIAAAAPDGKAATEGAADERKPHGANGGHDDDRSERDASAPDIPADAAGRAAADPVGAIAMMLGAGSRADGAGSGRGREASAEGAGSAAPAVADASATLADWAGPAGVGDGAEADAALDAFASAAVQAGLKGLATGAGSASIVDRRTHFAPVQSRALETAARAPDAAHMSMPDIGRDAIERLAADASRALPEQEVAVRAASANEAFPATASAPTGTEPVSEGASAPAPRSADIVSLATGRTAGQPIALDAEPATSQAVQTGAPPPASDPLAAPASASTNRTRAEPIAVDADSAPAQLAQTAAPLSSSTEPALRWAETGAATGSLSRTESAVIGAGAAPVQPARAAQSIAAPAPQAASGAGVAGPASAPAGVLSVPGIPQDTAAQQGVAAAETGLMRPVSDPDSATSLRDRGAGDARRGADMPVTPGRAAGVIAAPTSGDGAGRVSDTAGRGAGRDGLDAHRDATSPATREADAPARTAARTAEAETAANERAFGATAASTTAASGPTGPAPGGLPPTQLQRLAGAIAAGAADIKAQAGVDAAAALEPAALAAARDPVRTLDLQMHPATLGLVTVRMRLVGQSLELRVRAANPETARLLKADGGKLADLLSTSGYGTHILAIDAGGADTAGFISSVPQPSAGLADGGATWSGTGDQSRQQDRPSGGGGNGAPRGRSDFAGLTENADETSSRDRPGAVYV